MSPDATATLETLSRPVCGGYPYGVFGTAQRARPIDGKDALTPIVAVGGKNPLERAA